MDRSICDYRELLKFLFDGKLISGALIEQSGALWSTASSYLQFPRLEINLLAGNLTLALGKPPKCYLDVVSLTG